jgi:plastocyanin
MRKGMWSAAAVVMLVAGAVVVFAAPSLRAADNRVTLGSSDEPLKFLPAELTVPVGTRVEWVNDSDLQHDVTAEDGSFDSKGLLSKGQKYEFTFAKAGEFKYFCTPHKDAGMKGVVKVTAAGTPTTVATTPTTQGGPSATTATTAPGASTTTTAKGAGASSTTTTVAGNGATTTTLGQATTPTSAPDTAGETTTTTAAAGEAVASDHGSEGGGHEEKPEKENSPIGIAFASVSTVLLAAIAGKLLASKP